MIYLFIQLDDDWEDWDEDIEYNEDEEIGFLVSFEESDPNIQAYITSIILQGYAVQKVEEEDIEDVTQAILPLQDFYCLVDGVQFDLLAKTLSLNIKPN
jgi:hypothetical protein